jgi:glycosyltransferase involved in cell wall biosynthesis
VRLMFVYWDLDNAGSAQTLAHYGKAASALGHEVVLYAPERSGSRLACSLDVESADAVIFLLEWNIYLHRGDYLDLARPAMRAPREKRIVIDDDGMYNDVVRVDGDYTHPHTSASRRRTELYDSLSDKILQPTFHPLRPNVQTFLFHGYDPAWERPIEFEDKDYGMIYVGSNWFRWRALERVLRAIEPIRARLGRLGVVGHNWDAPPFWVKPPLLEAYRGDAAYLARLNVEVMPAVPIDAVVPTMSKATFNPVLVRPTFNHLRLVNPRLFETAAAGTIPLFQLDLDHVRELYGEPAGELVLDGDARDKIADVLERPEHYAAIATQMRMRLADQHSFTRRLEELIEIIES